MTHLQRQRRRRRHGGHARNKVLLGLSVIGAGLLLGMLALVGYVVSVAATAPDISSLKPINQGATSSIYAADGQRLGSIQADEFRTPIASAKIPLVVKQATVAIEDQRFYKHKGVDYEGIVRAAIKNLRSGKNLQGGSTITMQLVRNLYIEHPKRTFVRKIREAKLAEELEDQHTKAWILDKYLNSVSYGTFGGQTSVGIQAAARTIFDKPVTRLKLPEAALLAGLPQAPSQYNPFQDPQRRAGPPQRGAQEDGGPQDGHPGRGARRAALAARGQEGHLLHGAPRAVRASTTSSSSSSSATASTRCARAG